MEKARPSQEPEPHSFAQASFSQHETLASELRNQLRFSHERGEDMLVDESKEAQVHDLGEALKELELKGNYFGTYSLTIVVYDEDLAKVERRARISTKRSASHDAQLYEEKYNLFNAYLATVPGNYAFNLRSMLILNTNYADYSFLFTLHTGDRVNAHLKQEYLAVLETNHRTPYYLNLHCKDTAHSVILGRTGSGKSFLLNFLITNLQKYDPYTFIFDLGGSFESLTRLFGGTYDQVGVSVPRDSRSIRFASPRRRPISISWPCLCKFLPIAAVVHGLSVEEEQELYHANRKSLQR